MLVVTTPIGDIVFSDQVYLSYVVNVEGHELPVDLIVLDILDFDAIPGMDWLSRNHTKLD